MIYAYTFCPTHVAPQLKYSTSTQGSSLRIFGEDIQGSVTLTITSKTLGISDLISELMALQPHCYISNIITFYDSVQTRNYKYSSISDTREKLE